MPSKSWGNSNIVAVLARGGWGTIWQAIVNQKPIGVLEASPEDDPEIFHNARSVHDARIGTIINSNVEPLIGALPRYLSAIQEQLELDKKNFGKIDGIEFTSSRLNIRLKQILTETSEQKLRN